MSSKPKNTYATSMSVWGMIITVLTTIAGAILGAVIGFSSKPIVGDDIPDALVCGLLGLVAGLAIGGIVSLLIKFLGETGNNIALVAENTKRTYGTPSGGSARDPMDLLKYKELFDAGIISREEFEKIKLSYMYSSDPPSMAEMEKELMLLREQIERKKNV